MVVGRPKSVGMLSLLPSLLVGCTNAFIAPPTPFVSSPPAARLSALPSQLPQLLDALPTLALSDGGGALLEEGLGGAVVPVESIEAAGSFLDQVGSGLLTIASAIAVLIFATAGLVYLFASWIIPQAAEQLEKETKEVAPELWDEYEAKLEAGETLAMRPDLLKELGDKVQPLIEAKLEAEYNKQVKENEDVLSSLPPPPSQFPDVVDVTVIKEDKKDDNAK